MFVYSKERFCKAHTEPHLRASYDLYYRDAICSKCGEVIGEQIYWVIYKDKEYTFYHEPEKDKYKFCPYCGEPLKSEQIGDFKQQTTLDKI